MGVYEMAFTVNKTVVLRVNGLGYEALREAT